MRKLAMNAAVVGASLLVSALLVEGASRVYRAMGDHPPNNRYAFRLQQPPPYQNAPYFSSEFVDESFRQPNGWFVPKDTRLLIPGDFHGKYFNIDNGKRRTTDAPSAPKHTVFVLGGSTLYGQETPDAYTLTSYLQRALNERQPDVWRVENDGETSIAVSQQVELLRTLPVQPGDLVVFYDGVNDVAQGVVNGDPHGWVVGENRKVLGEAGPFKALLVKLNVKYAASKAQNYSAFIGTVIGEAVNSANLRAKPHLLDPKRVEALARETADLYRQDLESAQQIVAAKGATFVHFLQPQIFAAANRTPYEKALIGNYYLTPNGVETAFVATYPFLREADRQAHGVASFDISHALDERAPGEEFYLDYCHVNHTGNARIAVAIADGLSAAMAKD